MTTYDIKIFKNGVHVDNKTVRAETEGKAITAAMLKTKIVFVSAEVSYIGREVQPDGTQGQWRVFQHDD